MKANSPSRHGGPSVKGGSPEARKMAAAILEVLAGNLTPADAAVAMSVSPPRYYLLETRALEGLVAACEPRSKGPGHSLEKELESLGKEHERTKRELARAQALARVSQRAVAIGRKNWLFFGSHVGGKAAAVFFSLIASAKRHGLDPFEYLRDLFERLPAHPADRLHEFLPDKWKQLREKKISETPAQAAIPQ